MTAALIVLGSYLFGGVPVAYLTGRFLRGIDIREQGSGNVGASNVWQTVSRAAVVPVGVAEIGQGMAGIAVAKLARQSLSVQVLAGLAAVAGHNWSPYLRFSGGRGVGHAIGFMLMLTRPGLGAFIGVSLTGVALRAVPQFVGLALISVPIAALARRQAPELCAGSAALTTAIFTKRALSNSPSALLRGDAGRLLKHRLLYDRDTSEREAWVRRGRS